MYHLPFQQSGIYQYPVPSVKLLPQEFPVHAMPEKLQGVISELQRDTQAPVGLIASMMLSVMSLSIQDLFDISPKAQMRFILSLYQIILAESGERKTTIEKLLMSPARGFIAKLDAEYLVKKSQYNKAMHQWRIELRAYEKALERTASKSECIKSSTQSLSECLDRQPVEPVRIRLLINDATRAAVKQELGKGWPSLVLISDEAGSILSGELLHDTPLLNALWSGQQIEVNRATSEAFIIKDTRFGCVLQVQPGLFKEYVNRQGQRARDSGFFARTLLCQPGSTIGTRSSRQPFQRYQDTSNECLAWFHGSSVSLLERSIKRREDNNERVCMTLAPEASVRWNAEYDRIELMCGPTGQLKDFKDYASKQLEHVARIAGVLEAFMTGNNEVSLETMNSAIKIANFYLDSFMYLMTEDALPEELADVELLDNWLQTNHYRVGYGLFYKRWIRQNCVNELRNIARLNRALENLRQKGKIYIQRIGRKTYVGYNHQHAKISQSHYGY